jgi:hypothetical protein
MGQEVLDCAQAVVAREHQPRAVQVAGDELQLPVEPGQGDPLPHLSLLRHGAVRRSQLDDAPLRAALRRPGGEMDSYRLTVSAHAGNRRRQRLRDVDHEQIARVQQVRQLAEARVHEPPGGTVGDEQPHVVAPHAALLRGRGRLQAVGQLERQCGHTAPPATGSARA